jgi:DNA-binding winged helix-turn-helix (wHTH) protein
MITFDRCSRQMRVGDREVVLAKQRFDLLALLLDNRDEVLTKEYFVPTLYIHDVVSGLHFLHNLVTHGAASRGQSISDHPGLRH